jgi:hypothetical protein
MSDYQTKIQHVEATLGSEICLKQQEIRMKAFQGRKLLSMLKQGFEPMTTDLNTLIMWLLHYKQHKYLVEQFVLYNKSNDAFYTFAEKQNEEINSEYDEEYYDQLMTFMLLQKAKGDRSKIEKLLGIYFELVAKEWIEAKFIEKKEI